MHEYIKNTIGKLTSLDLQSHIFDLVSKEMAETYKRENTIYLFGTGHSHMIAEEVYVRAGSLASFQAILVPELMLHESATKSTEIERLEGYAKIIADEVGFKAGDMLFLISNSGRNAVPIELCKLAHDKGVTTVAITSLEHSKSVTARSGGRRLYEIADFTIDNLVNLGDAAILVDKIMVGPQSTILGSAIMNLLQIEMIKKLVEEGYNPDIFVSSNLESNNDNDLFFEKYHK